MKECKKKVEAYNKAPIECPVTLTVLFAIPRARNSKLLVPVGDGDNYEKATYDMLVSKGYLQDDKWITSATWKKRFIPHGENGYTQIMIALEPDEIDLRY